MRSEAKGMTDKLAAFSCLCSMPDTKEAGLESAGGVILLPSRE